jgi:glucose-1-phosphate cytidylyltransferase
LARNRDRDPAARPLRSDRLRRQQGDRAPGKATGGYGGFFVLSRQVGRYIKDDATVWEQEPMEQLAAEHELRVYFGHDFWQPMDTLRDERDLWASGKTPWKNW